MARTLARILLAPPALALLGLYRCGWIEFVTGSRLLALVPGAAGRWWRRVWYRRTLAGCGDDLEVDWMAAFRTPRAKVGHRVFVGTFCWIGWAEIGDDVMMGGHVTVLSGGRHHDFERLDVPMRQQPGELERIAIGADVWIGNGAIVLADVAPGTVVGAGAVVNRTFDPHAILAGIPARVIGSRAKPPSTADATNA
ncbi:MAG: acyltransferase [Deltaproteobacteria bacterium]|nr:acyltransferase [Deltaproteobacteria bacterium]